MKLQVNLKGAWREVLSFSDRNAGAFVKKPPGSVVLRTGRSNSALQMTRIVRWHTAKDPILFGARRAASRNPRKNACQKALTIAPSIKFF